MKTSCLRLKLVELNFFASLNADDQRKTYVSDVSKKKKNLHRMYSTSVYELRIFVRWPRSGYHGIESGPGSQHWDIHTNFKESLKISW